MHERNLILDVLLALGAGWLGGLLARRLRLPLLVGYILSGVLIGPHALGVIGESAHVLAMAGLGVALLLFSLGVRLSLADLLRVKNVAVWGGITQILLTIGLGVLLARIMSWPMEASLILGFGLALSSTTVLVKVLSERGEAHTQYARVVMGINITQDLASVVLVGVLPILGSLSLASMPGLGVLVAKGCLFIALMLGMARLVIPRLLRYIADLGSREIFLTTVLVLCLAGAGLAELLGFSLALGAFLAGMMISESDFHHESLATVTPLARYLRPPLFCVTGHGLRPRPVAPSLA